MMKQRRSFLALVLTLALTMTMTLPALAYEDTDPPHWQQMGYSSLEELLAEGWLTEEDYYTIAKDAFDREAELQAWMDAHPEECASFDPAVYFADNIDYYDSPEEYMEYWEMTQAEFDQAMLDHFISARMSAEDQQARIDKAIATYPNEYAAFDPYTYYNNMWYAEYYNSPQEYMADYEITEEEFRLEMLNNWAWDMAAQTGRNESIALEKLMAGGSDTGVNVMVNGGCILFPDVLPEITSGRTMVPLAAALEYMGAEVSYDEATHTALVSMGDHSFTHAIGTDTLLLPNGEKTIMDVSSYVKDGRTMVPIAFFAQHLGYDVYWDSDYATAVLLNHDGAVALLNEDFSLLNRVLYAMSGTGAQRKNQSLKSVINYDLIITMLDSLNGDKDYSVTLDGTTLTKGLNSSGTYSGNFEDLIDLVLENFGGYMYLDEDDLAEAELLRDILSKIDMEFILNTDENMLYVRGPLLAQLEAAPAADTWMPIPLNGLYDTLSADQITVGDLLVTTSFSTNSPFLAWKECSLAAGEIAAYIGDSCFTRSNGIYTMKWDMADYMDMEEAGSIVITVSITPSGDKSCAYSFKMDAAFTQSIFGLGTNTGNKLAVFDMKVSGSTAKTDFTMNLHIKNFMKAALDMNVRVSATNQEPLSQPPAGDPVDTSGDYVDWAA